LASDACHGSDVGSEICGKIVASIAKKNVRAQIGAERIARPALVGARDA
jgi:hypothetical protein